MSDWVLANTGKHGGRMGVFSFYPTREAAEADEPRANGPDWAGWGPYVVMTWDIYQQYEHEHYTSGPTQEITAEHWTEMLEVLPPRQWIQEPGYNSFLMSEHTSGPYTTQYVAIGSGAAARYYCKTVDSTDRTTWIARDYDGADTRIMSTTTKTFGPYDSVDGYANPISRDHALWFSKDTKRWFSSRVSASLYGGRVFVSSERDEYGLGTGGKRLYKARIATADGQIEDIGGPYTSRATAHRIARRFAERYAAELPTMTTDRARHHAALWD